MRACSPPPCSTLSRASPKSRLVRRYVEISSAHLKAEEQPLRDCGDETKEEHSIERACETTRARPPLWNFRLVAMKARRGRSSSLGESIAREPGHFHEAQTHFWRTCVEAALISGGSYGRSDEDLST